MRKPGRDIPPHEPLQPLVGFEDTMEDVRRLEELVREKHERRQRALRRLQEAGMKVLGLDEPQEEAVG